MWRTLIITQGEKISIKDSWLMVESPDSTSRIPVSDIYSIVVDNRQTYLTVGAITMLTNAGVHVLFCDEKHNPVSVVMPLNTHYRPLNVLKKQFELSIGLKDALWQEIIKAKIENQAKVLKLQNCNLEVYHHLHKFQNEVTAGDKTNREGLSAKMFFRALYGSEFVRMRDDAINAALNYGYAIIRSAVAKTLAAYGYNCVLGIHHISETNPFNLADDLMEPLRPVVDLWVDRNHEDLVSELTPMHKKSIIDIMNTTVRITDKNMKLRYAIDRYICSLTSSIEHQDVSLSNIPMISNHTLQRGEFGDD